MYLCTHFLSGSQGILQAVLQAGYLAVGLLCICLHHLHPTQIDLTDLTECVDAVLSG